VAGGEQETVVTDVTRRPPKPATSDCLVVIYAKDKSIQGRRFLLESGPLRVGRMPDNEIVLDDDGVSRRHARIEPRGEPWFVMDVGSRNGTLLNERELDGEARLVNGDRIKIGSTIFKYLSGADAESAYFEEIFQLSITDNLTQVHNRKHFDEAFEREFSRARRHQRPLSVLVVDIDFFKQVNDQFGHLAGDLVLHEVAQALKLRLRRDELIARYGGEEFALLLAETELAGAGALAEDLRRAVESLDVVFQGVSIPVRVSIGCAEVCAKDRAAADLFQRADEKLYEAKRSGRNRVVR
jgi:two-component system, cell cycle response regulator